MLPLSGEGGSQLQSAANQVAFNAEAPLDGAATPATLENLTLEGENMPATVTYLSREYIWGPGDWGVDELLVQYDEDRRASWPLQDAGGDVIALCDLGGTSGTARVITQIVYDAYGSVIGRDDPATPATGPPELRVGHKRLFFDRLDGGIADPLTGFDLPRLWPGARLSGHVRNRTLHCDFGRWNQPDPNATGLVVQASLSYHGGGMSPSVQTYDLYTHLRDGPNVMEYIGSSPWTSHDPLGLSWDPFDMVDEVGFEHQLSGFVALAKIDSFFRDKEVLRKIRAYERGGFEFMDMVWDRDVGILFSMIGGPFFSKICFVEGTVVATPTGPEPIECLDMGREVTSRPDPQHASADGVELLTNPNTISLVRLRYDHADGSTTIMEMLRPAELIASLGVVSRSRLPVALAEMGFAGEAEVLSVEPYGKPIRLDVPVVTGRFVTDCAEVVDVYLVGHDIPLGVTPKHPVFSADRQAWVASGELRPGEQLQTNTGITVVARVHPRAERTPVYNVEVSRYHTYFVGEAGVWAHNPCFPANGSRGDQVTWVTRTIESMRKAGGAPPRIIYEFVATTLREANLSKSAYLELLKHAKSILRL